MTLQESDELLHLPPAPAPPNWQENFFFILWDTAGRNGLLVHLQRVPGLGIQEAQMVVSIGGELSSGSVVGPYIADKMLSEFEAEAVVPFERWQLRADFEGSGAPGPLGVLALGKSGDLATSVEVTLESSLPAADFAPALAEMVANLRAHDRGPQMSDQHHYEQGGTWTGRLRIADREVEATGLFVRDHSWGVRDEQRFQAFWTASCLDEGRLFCNAIGILRGNEVVGVGVMVDRSGTKFTSQVSAAFAPRAGMCSYETVRVHYGAGVSEVLDASTQVHVPIYLPHSGPRRYDNNAISEVELAGKRGFGVMEWADVLDEHEAAQLV